VVVAPVVAAAVPLVRSLPGAGAATWWLLLAGSGVLVLAAASLGERARHRARR